MEAKRLADLPTLGVILILAPVGRDAAELERVLAAISVPTQILDTMADLSAALQADGGAHAAALFLTEEALAGETDRLAACLNRQPPWSDMPIVILTAGGHRRRSGARTELFGRLGNVTLLDRPLLPETLQTAARAAIRARARQHLTRHHLEALLQATETLEMRVEERTRELMVLQERLHQAQKMEAIGQLTGGLAHDFNNLLTVISGGAESLQRVLLEIPLGAAQNRVELALRMIMQGAERAAALTHRLLAFSRRQTLDAKPTDVNWLVAGMEDLIRRTMGPAIEITVRSSEDLWTTLVDQHQLETSLLNLCINARDAMPDGGRLVIEASNRILDAGTAAEWEVKPGDYVTVTVRDTGTGMQPEILAHVFEPFFTTKPIGQGTGLGLSMIYGFAQQSGGGVEIASTVGDGTTVRIFLPRFDGIPHVELPRPAPAAIPQPERAGTVLIVDDEPLVRLLVAEALAEMGYDVIEAEDGRSGLNILQSSAQIDLLISDVGLPGGMNGRQLVDAARQSRPDLSVLFITGYAENAVLGDRGLAPGMYVMTKPFTMEALALRVHQIMR